MPPDFSAGDTAWVLAASALVLLMTPGVALFYGGMVRAKSVLNMLMMSFICLAIVSVLWVLFGYSLAFGTDSASGLIGNLEHVGFLGIKTDDLSGSVPTYVFAAFQLMFAILTPALISGAIADRAKFGAWVVFVALWSVLVYFPVAHWVFFFDDGKGGWIGDRLGALDFAGGTAVHINAGVAALALVLVLGPRLGFKRDPMRPHNLPLVMLGAGLLWFGWFGFNAGSALAANGLASVAFLNTQVATAAAVLGWLMVEKLRDGHATTLGAASGAVAGLVAITPACASVDPLGAIAIGLIAGVVCAFAVGLKYKLGYDDSLDVVGVHAVGGFVGSLLIGLFATQSVTGPEGAAGLFYGGGLTQLGKQAIGAFAVAAYSFVISFILAKAIDLTMGFRVSSEDEVTGVDLTTHAETAYEFGPLIHGATTRSLAGTAAGAPPAGRTSVSDKTSDQASPAGRKV
ncbi:ammonia channel protein [Carbonactinospora thermoautotrophica]|uniref:ammonium transporter n=1 Tax=Carbonactinospora thermoautotrophica TaxID=1469144 RepID=UPI00226F416E|nr:ammonium transporter [Carbonactinospora thermoautotrophica]MCX9191775.1 ammonia channel protein [Carbonactinospora thermoautotrophica]